jgi:hypothetical protein
MEIVESPDTDEIFLLAVGAPHSWRVIHLDGRALPENPEPTWYGHSVGRWEGATLVVESTGYNARAWLTREGVPYTSQLKLTERISRPNRNQLRYEATVDDPGATLRPGVGAGTCAGPKATSPSTTCARRTIATRRA